MGLIKDRNKAP